MEIAKFPGPPPSFLCFCTAGGEKSGGAWNQSKWVRVYTLRHYYPFLPSHNHCYAHTHSPRWLLCAMKSRTGCSTMLTLRSKRSSSKRETLRNGSNPTWPNWHRHQDSDCLFVIVYHQFMSAASVCSIHLETSQKSLQEQSLWFLSNFFCWCVLFTKP